MTFTLDFANLIAIWLESVFYGIYVLLFFHTVYTLHRPRPNARRNATNWTLLAACFALFIFSTTHVAMSLRMLIEAFILDKKIPGGANAYFADEGMYLSLGRKAVFALSVIIADVLMIYRCYILWHRNPFIVVVPVLTLCTTVIASSFIAKELINFHPSVERGIFTPQLDAWVPAYFFSAFASGIYLSVCIAWKLWYAAKKAQPDMLQFSRMLATVIVVESNSIYPLTNAIALLCWGAKSNVQVIPVNVLAQIIAIAPTLMILQVQKGLYSPYSYPVYETESNADPKARKSSFTDFTSPYAFMPRPRSSVHFPSLSRSMSTNTFKDRWSVATAKGEGRVAYTKYGGTFGINPILPPASRKGPIQKQGVTVTSTAEVDGSC